MNPRKTYHKEYNARPENKAKRKAYRKALLILRSRYNKEFKEIYYSLLNNKECLRKI